MVYVKIDLKKTKIVVPSLKTYWIISFVTFHDYDILFGIRLVGFKVASL